MESRPDLKVLELYVLALDNETLGIFAQRFLENSCLLDMQVEHLCHASLILAFEYSWTKM